MTTVRVDYTPNPRQVVFHDDPRPRRWYCAGYGSGKTFAAVMEAFVNATIRHPGYLGVVVAPTFPLLWQGWVDAWRALFPSDSGLYRIREGADARMFVRTPCGQTSTVVLRSTSNPRGLEAMNAAWAVFDEASRERDPASYAVLLGRLRRGYPGRQRGIVLTGYPMTRRHWTAKEFGAGPGTEGRTGTHAQWGDRLHAVIRARTRDNPFLPPNYERDLRARPSATRAWCAQYLDAEFGAMEGQVYEAFNRSVHIVPAASLAGRRWRRVVVGVDWGYTHPGVMVVLGQDGAGDIYVLAEEVHERKIVADTADGWVPIAVKLARSWSPEGFFCDPSQPGHLETLGRGLRVARQRAGVFDADNDVGEGIRTVSARLESATDRADRRRGIVGRPALYVSDACAHTVGEFESYARQRARDGTFSETPEKKGDDAMDALRYGVMACA